MLLQVQAPQPSFQLLGRACCWALTYSTPSIARRLGASCSILTLARACAWAQVQAPQSSSSSLGMGPPVDPPVRQPYASASGSLGGDAPASAPLQAPGSGLSAPAGSAWGAKPKAAAMALPIPAPAPAPGPSALMPASLGAPGTPSAHSAGAGPHHGGGLPAMSAAPLAMSAAMAAAAPNAAGGGGGGGVISSAAAQVGGSYGAPESKAPERVILPPQVPGFARGLGLGHACALVTVCVSEQYDRSNARWTLFVVLHDRAMDLLCYDMVVLGYYMGRVRLATLLGCM